MNAYETFRALHRGDRILLLANAWDAVSAALFAASGSQAIATTSAGLAWSRGYADGNALPRASLLSAVGAICAVVGDKPVSADIENGYSDSADKVADLVAQLHGFGVAGINLEDGDGTPENLAAKIAAVKARVRASGGDVFINARADVFLRELVPESEAVRETIARAKRYAAAGADGIFVPDLKQRDDIRAIAASIELPLNVLAVAGLPSAPELYALGVRRISAGSALAKLALGTARDAAERFLREGDCGVLFSPQSIDYARTNALLRS
ncbi:MAG: isocitrate lyase/phosphoenolpyruvate mutase family protein [Candidatus Eremiobacteraeota bacterium]|nr:isocitrate lyase/phosphoenolpyruvate mutase family protein [Candidatus Eremiobacteraeota bacterium]